MHLAMPDVHSGDLGCAPAQQALGEPPGSTAHIQTAKVPNIQPKMPERRF
jgi:hypothetical protein